MTTDECRAEVARRVARWGPQFVTQSAVPLLAVGVGVGPDNMGQLVLVVDDRLTDSGLADLLRSVSGRVDAGKLVEVSHTRGPGHGEAQAEGVEGQAGEHGGSAAAQ